MPKVLVVDDSAAIRSALREMLESKGYSVVEAEDGLLGLEVAKENPDISLLISDMQMPVMDGLEMCERLREIPEFSKLPIFILSSVASVELKARGKAAGVMLWVIKPHNKENLLQVIAKVVPI